VIRLFRVKGSSMLPSFKPGQIVFARKTRNLSVNDVVVLKTHDNSQIIKRISKIRNREIRVSGDNSEYDSRYNSQKFNPDSVLGKVFFKI
jgi:Predicted transcriptional regulator|tara:strand:- start:128 stop:397 length:270 start_codon:yes stop_codon:yes gene_type:complete